MQTACSMILVVIFIKQACNCEKNPILYGNLNVPPHFQPECLFKIFRYSGAGTKMWLWIATSRRISQTYSIKSLTSSFVAYQPIQEMIGAFRRCNEL